MTIKSTIDTVKTKVVKRQGISAVWLVPAIALLFGAWLFIKAISDRGVFITVQFDSASGIEVGKTEVRYKGLVIGKVTEVKISKDIQKVNVEIEMIPDTKKRLTDKTKFWSVTADVSYQGVTGLDTLLSGGYIGIQPDFKGIGIPKTHFIGLKKAPPVTYDTPGLHIELTADSLGSLAINSPVSYKKMQVGNVSNYKYDENTDSFYISLLIEPKYAGLVKNNSRFWNAGGVEVTGSLASGMKVRTESLASIIGGGIAFDASEFEAVGDLAENGQKYTLHSDFETAKMGHAIEFLLSWNSGIDVGSAIMYQGLTLGKITAFKNVNPEEQKIVAQAMINPRIKPYLTEEASFYVVSPKVDLSGLSNLNSLVFGTHIAMIPSVNGAFKSSFEVLKDKPPYRYTEPGLHLVLQANEIGSLHQGTGVFYKQNQVGSIQAIQGVGPDDYLVHIHIEKEYENYVDQDSRFWNSSGFSLEGGIQNLDIDVQSMQTLLSGGIAFDKGRENGRKQPSNGEKFKLYGDDDIAKQRIPVSLTVPLLGGINEGTRIIYRGEKIGSVHNIKRNKNGVQLQAGLLPEFEYVLRESTDFWLVKPSVSLSGIADTDALFGGAYIALNAGEGKKLSKFVIASTPPAKHISAKGLQLKLSTISGNVVSPGSPISYRGIAVGQVDNVSLAENGKKVDINITVDENYRHLITNYTRFYNAGGVTVLGGLSGLVVKTESADAILRGGISFYNPKENENTAEITEGSDFTLFDNVKHAQNAGQAIKIKFKMTRGLTTNLKVKYYDHEVGFVERLEFDRNNFSVTAYVFLDNSGRNLAKEGAKFWFAESQVGLVGNKNVANIIDGGYIGVIPGKGEDKFEFDAKTQQPVIESLPFGLNLKLTAEQRGSVSVGDPVLYRQVKVGSVIGVGLDSTSSQVNIFVNINDEFSKLVSTKSKFWNTSGVRIEAGLFSGVTVESESLETMLSGGIAFATPESTDGGGMAGNGQEFYLNEVIDTAWKEWKPIINR